MCFKPPQPLKKFDLQKFFKSLSAGLTNQPYMAYSTRDNPLNATSTVSSGIKKFGRELRRIEGTDVHL